MRHTRFSRVQTAPKFFRIHPQSLVSSRAYNSTTTLLAHYAGTLSVRFFTVLLFISALVTISVAQSNAKIGSQPITQKARVLVPQSIDSTQAVLKTARNKDVE